MMTTAEDGALALPIDADLCAIDPDHRLAPAMIDLLVAAIRSRPPTINSRRTCCRAGDHTS